MRPQGAFKKCKIIHCAQTEFIEKHRTTDHIVALKSLISERVSSVNKGRIYGCFVDFRKAYDSVWYDGLLTKLSALNIKGSFLNILEDMYSKSSCAVNVSKKSTNFFDCIRVVRHGCPLSPLLFNIYFNDSLYQ